MLERLDLATLKHDKETFVDTILLFLSLTLSYVTAKRRLKSSNKHFRFVSKP